MGNINNMKLHLAHCNIYTFDDLPEVLAEEIFWHFDSDMNGENGEEYLWEKAQEKGFENNLDYLIHLYKEIMTSSWHNQDDHWKINDCFEHFRTAYKVFDQYYTIGDPCIDTVDHGNTWSISIPWASHY